jgi:hypothetical protein
VEQELMRLHDEWMRAIVRRDNAVLERLLADDFVGVGTYVVNRQQWLHNALQNIDVTAFDYRTVIVNLHGDTAVIVSTCTQEASVSGLDASGEFLVTDVWIRRREAWLVTVRHGTWVRGI